MRPTLLWWLLDPRGARYSWWVHGAQGPFDPTEPCARAFVAAVPL